MAQIRKDLAAERDSSLRTAVEQERARWEARLERELKQARLRSEAERQVSLGLQGCHISTQVHILNHLIYCNTKQSWKHLSALIMAD